MQRKSKAEFIRHWESLSPNQDVAMDPVSYKHEGSSYAEDTIRITGSPAFVDSVLSRMKDLLAGENERTRLQVSYQPIMLREDPKVPHPLGSVACYIQTVRRGPQSLAIARSRR